MSDGNRQDVEPLRRSAYKRGGSCDRVRQSQNEDEYEGHGEEEVHDEREDEESDSEHEDM